MALTCPLQADSVWVCSRVFSKVKRVVGVGESTGGTFTGEEEKEKQFKWFHGGNIQKKGFSCDSHMTLIMVFYKKETCPIYIYVCPTK